MSSETQIKRRLSEARKQLYKWVRGGRSDKEVFGCIALDVTRAAYDHDGLTFGLTNDHARENIQDKLIALSSIVNDYSPFVRKRVPILCWMQIHMPATVTYPPTAMTRFSSYFIFKDYMDRREARASHVLRKVLEMGSVRDKREAPSEKLTPRDKIEIPDGAKFYVNEVLIEGYLSTGCIPGADHSKIVGGLDMNGEEYEFHAIDLQMVLATMSSDERGAILIDDPKNQLNLLARMFYNRNPFL